MSWNYRYPVRENYDSYDEYEAACEAYEIAEDNYIDECMDRHYERYNE